MKRFNQNSTRFPKCQDFFRDDAPRRAPKPFFSPDSKGRDIGTERAKESMPTGCSTLCAGTNPAREYGTVRSYKKTDWLSSQPTGNPASQPVKSLWDIREANSANLKTVSDNAPQNRHPHLSKLNFFPVWVKMWVRRINRAGKRTILSPKAPMKSKTHTKWRTLHGQHLRMTVQGASISFVQIDPPAVQKDFPDRMKSIRFT